ncbi:MAG: RNA-binding S4 domain-containing protein [Sedimenticola sp.]
MSNQSDQFTLKGREYIELNNLLKLTGQCSSGGAAKMAITHGEVKVDGVVELRKRCKIRPGQRVSIGSYEIDIQP